MVNARGAGLPETAATEKAASAPPRARRTLLRWLPLVVVALALFALYAAGLADYLSLDALRRYQGTLASGVAERPMLTAAGYVAVYITVVAISFPGAGAMTIEKHFTIDRAAKRYVLKYHMDRCIYCGQCVVNCKFKCIGLSNEDWEHALVEKSFTTLNGKEEDVAGYLDNAGTAGVGPAAP